MYEMGSRFPNSGEIYFAVKDVASIFETISSKYHDIAVQLDWFDGLSMAFDDWRFNLRASATEPLLRLNVETRGDPTLLEQKVNELKSLIENS